MEICRLQDFLRRSGRPSNWENKMKRRNVKTVAQKAESVDQPIAVQQVEPETTPISPKNDSPAAAPDSKPSIDAKSPLELPDPFDPARLRLSQNFEVMTGVKKLVMTVPVRKPAKEWFVMTHSDEAYRITTAVLELKEDREIYLVDPNMWPTLSAEPTFSPRLLITTINRQGNVFLWPIRLPGPDGRIDEWNRSAFEAAQIGRGQWVRVAANMGLGAYDVTVATGQLSTPEWPALSFSDLLRIAFRDKVIRDTQHPVLKRLRGEV
jgi:hypothetical protein